MSNVFVDVFLLESVAVTVTVVVPTGNRLPDAGLAVTVGHESTLSTAYTWYVTRAAPDTYAPTVIPDGHVIVGAVVSLTRPAPGGFPLASAGARPTNAPSASRANAATNFELDAEYLMDRSFPGDPAVPG